MLGLHAEFAVFPPQLLQEGDQRVEPVDVRDDPSQRVHQPVTLCGHGGWKHSRRLRAA
jgi:hypothetical protein